MVNQALRTRLALQTEFRVSFLAADGRGALEGALRELAMRAPETTTVFTGVDARKTIDLPEWYRARHESDEITTFAEAIRSLPEATETKVAYEKPYTGEWVE